MVKAGSTFSVDSSIPSEDKDHGLAELDKDNLPAVGQRDSEGEI